MKLLKTITDADVSSEEPAPATVIPPRSRRAARAVVFDEDGKAALLYVANHEYYKLPGGGIEEGEDIIEALKRECLEEIGCNVIVKGEIGEIREVRNQKSLDQTSYCYLAELEGPKGKPNFEQDELNDGFKEMWMNLDDAIDVMKKSKPKGTYNGPFIVMRDMLFLETAKTMRTRHDMP